MPDERRYSSTEIEMIFETAAKERGTLTDGSARDGLTLPELQAIGEEVGLPPQRIADAAALLDREQPVQRRLTLLGVPIGVRMSFDLPRAPSDREWGMLVAELRRTFGAEGRVTSAVELREWRNGALHAAVEPTSGGYRLRLGTKKSQVPVSVLGSAIWFMLALGILQDVTAVGSILLAILGLLFLGPLLRLPAWAKLRESQMEQVGLWATELLSQDRTIIAPPPPPAQPE